MRENYKNRGIDNDFEPPKSVVVVGPQRVGKSAFIQSHITGNFPGDWGQDLVEQYLDEDANIQYTVIKGDHVNWETFDADYGVVKASSEDQKKEMERPNLRIRNLFYANADAIVVCFSFTDSQRKNKTLLRTYFEQEIQFAVKNSKRKTKAHIFLVGLKSELQTEVQKQENENDTWLQKCFQANPALNNKVYIVSSLHNDYDGFFKDLDAVLNPKKSKQDENVA